MICRQCHTANPADNKFCKECGTAIEHVPAPPGELEPEAAAQVAEFLDRAFAASEQDALEDAILACKAALVLHPRSATAHSLLASLYERRNDIPSAIAELEAALAVNPESEADREKLAQLQGRIFMQKNGPALAAYPFARKLSPPVLAAVATALVVMLVGSMAMLKGIAPRNEATPNAPAAGYPDYAYTPDYQAAPGPYPNTYTMGEESQAQGQQQPVAPQVQGGTVYPIGEPQSPVPVQTPAPRMQPQPDRSLPPIPSMPLTVIRPQEQLQPLPGNGRTAAPTARPKPGYAAPQIDITTREAPEQPRVRRQEATAPESTAPAAGNGNSEEVARRYQAAGNYEGALTAYRNALSTASDTGPIYQQIGLCLQRLQRYPQAKEAYQQAISAYQTAIASGRNAENARHGIETCEAAIAVCEGQ